MTASASTQRISAREIFAAAVKLDDGPAREQLIELACRGDDSLLAQVQALLAADTQSRNELNDVAARLVHRDPAPGPATTETFITDSCDGNDDASAPPLDVAKHPQIGPYKIRELIGEGGMGYVYVAEQTRPVRRKVALKVIKPGMDTKEVVARFEAERQALAMMSHPNIAKVLDGGATDQGRPYFVMELVRGEPITKFCDQRKLTTRERLELFLKVCQAVQHAHMKGIIHRDLKPSNVIVEVDDVRPIPKVIDFGVAKATGQQLSQQTVYTQFSQLVGTPLYMSPEQAKQSSTDIDTRSDIYSLGVLLYELLTGTTPFDKDTLSSANVTELQRIICEDEPPRPSLRISTLKNEQLSTISASRKAEPGQLGLSMQRELDWIVMKAIEKDRTRRYESASAFAADIQRYLDDEPVLACPPSVGYRMRKYARKHKRLLTTAAIVVVMLLMSTVVSTGFAYQAGQAKEAAEQSEQQANKARELADERLEQSREDFDLALKSLNAIIEHSTSEELANLEGAEQIRQQILASSLELFDEILERHDNDPYARLQQAKAHRSIFGMNTTVSGRPSEFPHLEEAISILEELIAEYPDEFQYQQELMSALVQWAYHSPNATPGERRDAHERALAICRRGIELAALTPGVFFADRTPLHVANYLPMGSPERRALIEESLQISRFLNQDLRRCTTSRSLHKWSMRVIENRQLRGSKSALRAASRRSLRRSVR